jgi:hypothetical protein
MKIYSIALYLYLFSMVLSLLNGIYTTSAVPELNMESPEAHVSEITEITDTPVTNMFWEPMVLVKMVGVVINSFLSAVYILPMLTKFGFSADICYLLQGAVAFVYVVGLIQFITGRYFKSIA